MLVPGRQRARPVLVAHQQRLTLRYHSNPSYRQIAEMLGISVRKIQYKLQQYRAAPKSHVEAVAAEAEKV